MSDLNNRIINLETQYAFQEESIEQLNAVIIKQQKLIDKIQRQLVNLNNKINEESQHWNQSAANEIEKPPHY